MSCQASRLKASKHTEKVSVLWNGRDSIRKKQTQQRNQLPRYTIELARTNTESKASFRKEVSPYDKLNPREPPLRTESEQQQIVRIVLNNNFTSSDRDQNNIQIDIINSRPASKAGRLESMLAVEAPETPTPVARYNIARNGITATEKPYQSKTLSESNYASSHVTRKKIFPLDTSKISLSAIGDHLPNSKAPEVLIQDISMTESQHKSTISRHSMKPIQPLGLSKASAQQSNQEPSKIASNEPSSFPMLQKKLLETSAHHSSLVVSNIHQKQLQAIPLDKQNRPTSGRKKIFVHPIKIKRNNGHVTQMKPPPIESYSLQTKLLQSIHSAGQSVVMRRLPIFTDIGVRQVPMGCCL